MAADQQDRTEEFADEIERATEGVDFGDVIEQLAELRRAGLIPSARPELESPHGSGMSRLVS